MMKTQHPMRVRRSGMHAFTRSAGHRGVTLIELMIGLVVGSLVTLAITTVFIMTVGASNATLASVRLNQDLRSAMLIISSDIRRAGYWNQNLSLTNPFEAGSGQGFQLGACEAEGINCSRIDYAFDRNRDGAITADESYGFRYTEGAIEMRNPGSDEAEAWMQLVGGDNDPIDITELSFSAINPDSNPPTLSRCINISAGDDNYSECSPEANGFGDPGDTIQQKRRIRIELSGQVGDQTIRLDETVKIRNNRRFVQQ